MIWILLVVLTTEATQDAWTLGLLRDGVSMPQMLMSQEQASRHGRRQRIGGGGDGELLQADLLLPVSGASLLVRCHRYGKVNVGLSDAIVWATGQNRCDGLSTAPDGGI